MKTLLASITAAGLLLGASSALAQDTGAIGVENDFDAVDTNRDALVSWVEFELMFPNYNEAEFRKGDIDGDGYLSADEFDGLVVATGSTLSPAESGAAEPEETENM